jgi:L-cystine uptake protein TcyP (sodium:dicarboxylate symporter family)
MHIQLILNLALALAVCALLVVLQKRHVSFTKRVFTGLGLGVLLGAAFQAVYGNASPVIAETNAYLDIVGTGYVKLLQMIIMPLIMVSIIQAVLKLRDASSLGRISVLTIGTLMATTAVAAGIGILMAKLYGLSAVGLTSSAAEAARGAYLEGKLATAQQISLPSMILSFLPENPFLDMTGARKTSTIAVVLFSIFIGVSATGIAGKKPEVFESFSNFVHVAHVIVMRMVTLVLRLTPFGVFALITQVLASSSLQDILHLLGFVMASYSALILMFCVHLAIIAATGLNPLRYVKKIFPVLAFAFTSRTSAGSIPMSVQTQTARLGTPEGIANFAASFGSMMGQNGCAGIYPAMLAVMIAPTVGIDPYTSSFLLSLIGIVTIGSVGVAGVGGGALISIEPLSDMGRTALNVSGSITAGTVASRVLGQTDVRVFDSDADINLDGDQQVA